MNAAAAGGGMQGDAGGRTHVVRRLGAVQCRDGAIGFPGGDHVNAVRGQHGAQAHRQRQHQVFFQQVVGQARSAIGAPMGGVDHHRKARRRLRQPRAGRVEVPAAVAVGSCLGTGEQRRQSKSHGEAGACASSIQRIDGKTAQ